MRSSGQSAKETDMDTIGGMSLEEFDEMNAQGAEEVASLMATEESLSESDEKLMLEVAMGGMMQLEISRLAIDSATDEEVLLLAQAEVVEQTGLSEKLKEIAGIKGVTLPSAPSADAQAMLEKLSGLSGDEFDRAYVQESGVRGHELLDDVLERVETKAEDGDLVELASAARPLVQTHLQVARSVLDAL